MHIEINGNTEKLIQAGLDSGMFHTAEEVMAAMARAWTAAENRQAAAIPQLASQTDLTALVACQGITPFDPANPTPNFWPEGDTSDEFMNFLANVRRDG